jgi:hypothetical protein
MIDAAPVAAACRCCPAGLRDQLLVRYYLLPQQTHTGRLSTHGARELFLGCKVGIEATVAAATYADAYACGVNFDIRLLCCMSYVQPCRDLLVD